MALQGVKPYRHITNSILVGGTRTRDPLTTLIHRRIVLPAKVFFLERPSRVSGKNMPNSPRRRRPLYMPRPLQSASLYQNSDPWLPAAAHQASRFFYSSASQIVPTPFFEVIKSDARPFSRKLTYYTFI